MMSILAESKLLKIIAWYNASSESADMLQCFLQCDIQSETSARPCA